MVVYTLEQHWKILRQIDLQKKPILAKKIFFSDEAYLDLGGYVNKQNCRIWGTENQHLYIAQTTHPKRFTVWCGFWSKGIIGPFFFENEQAEKATINGDRYRTKLNDFLLIKIEEEELATFCFNRTALRATQPKRHSMFCALFWKIAIGEI